MRIWRWLVLILGIWQLSSTYALGIRDPFAVAASVLLGFLVVLAGVVANLMPDRWPFVASGVLGLTLVAVPFIHPSGASAEFLIVGALTCIASLVEFVDRQHA
jgi:hypothetical protein